MAQIKYSSKILVLILYMYKQIDRFINHLITLLLINNDIKINVNKSIKNNSIFYYINDVL